MRHLTMALLFTQALAWPQQAPAGQQAISQQQILEGAEARIQQHRTGEVVLRLVTAPGGPELQGRHLEILQTRHSFLFGGNIFKLGKCRTAEDNAAYAGHFAELFNFATLPFYWWMYEAQQGRPQYAETERFLAWCREHGITAKGHPLAWNSRDPPWLPTDPQRAMEAQLGRIREIMERFRQAIPYWDVVNEATQYDRPQTNSAAPILTAAIRSMGLPNYIRTAFATAHRADPGAALIINDYRTDSDYADRVVSKLVSDQGRPLYDVVGIQCHQHRGAWPAAKIWEICERFAAYGKPLHFTEATILSGEQGINVQGKARTGRWPSTPDGERRQAEETERFYTVLFSHPSVEAITWWDFSDQGAWQQAPAGLLRADMTQKPVYERLKRLIKQKWWTCTEATAGQDGSARFKGFFGEYEITMTIGADKWTGRFSFDRTTRQPIAVRLEK